MLSCVTTCGFHGTPWMEYSPRRLGPDYSDRGHRQRCGQWQDAVCQVFAQKRMLAVCSEFLRIDGASNRTQLALWSESRGRDRIWPNLTGRFGQFCLTEFGQTAFGHFLFWWGVRCGGAVHQNSTGRPPREREREERMKFPAGEKKERNFGRSGGGAVLRRGGPGEGKS